MIDVLVDTVANDIVITNGVVQTVTGTDHTVQAIRLTLLTFQGEWFADEEFGVPWFARVLGHRFNAGQIQLTVTEPVLVRSDVASISDITTVKTGVRGATVNMTVLTTSGAEAIIAAEVP